MDDVASMHTTENMSMEEINQEIARGAMVLVYYDGMIRQVTRIYRLESEIIVSTKIPVPAFVYTPKVYALTGVKDQQ